MITEIYDILSPIATTRWLGQDNKASFPQLVYSIIDYSGLYSFGVVPELDDLTIQVAIYENPSELASIETLTSSVKTAMESIDYMLVNSPQEFIDEETKKVIRFLRFSKLI